MQRLPDRHGLGREVSIGKGYDEWRAGSQDTANFVEYIDGALQLLYRNVQTRAVKMGVFQRKYRVYVQVLNEPLRKTRVCGELFLTHPVADDAGIGDLIGQMADPAAHQIQHLSTGWQALAVSLRHNSDRAIIDMGDEPRETIELGIR